MNETRPFAAEPLDSSLTSRLADRSDRYERLLRLADVFDSAGDQLRQRAALGGQVLHDPAFADSADLAAPTYARVEEDVRAATTGKHGLLARSVELDADALVVRATVLTYQWIDDLRDAAYETLGAIAGKAIGYLAPEVALGGAIVTAGLIETDALDRDGVAAYLSELAVDNPELMDHVTSGGGGLLDGLQMRAVLTAGVLSGDPGREVARGGLRALGVDAMRQDSSAAVRDVAGGLLTTDRPPREPRVDPAEAADPAADSLPEPPASVADLMQVLQDLDRPLLVQRTAPGRYVGYLGPLPTSVDELRDPGDDAPVLLGGDLANHVDVIGRGIAAAVDGDPDAHVLLTGGGASGAVAAQLAARLSTRRADPATVGTSPAYAVDSLVTAGAPGAHVPRLPASVRMLALEDRADPVALLGSLVTAGEANRTTVVFDAAGSGSAGVYVTGGRAADAATAPALVAEIQRLRDLGYLTS